LLQPKRLTKMKIKYSYLAVVMVIATMLSSCKKEEFGSLSTGDFTDTEGTLKTAAATAGFPIGIAVDYNLMLNNAAYRETVAREANSTTFEYHMKHGALVKDDGSIDFLSADQLYNAAAAAGLEVFGHTLGWHENQNANYLRSLSGPSGPAPASIILNGGFELGSGDNFTNWNKYNGGTSFTEGTGAEFVRSGSRSLKVTVAADNPGGQWRVQLASDLMPTEVGKAYKVTFWIKAATAGGSMRLSTQPSAQYQGDQTIGTDWAPVSWTFTAKDPETRILFDMGAKANTYYVDDVTVVDAAADAPPSGAEVAERVDNALKEFITQTVTHYKGKVKAWDVVNEPVVGSGALRDHTNTVVPSGANDVFFWSQYLGRDWGLKAFQYAAKADPEALLFINDFGLESSGAKLDSLIAYVAELKAKGAKIDGIGTQMHISINTPHAGIVTMFKKLAATGLKVRISELDVRLNPSDLSYISADPLHMGYQAAMYKSVVDAYMEHVPAAQRHGITVWGVADQESWIVVHQKKNDFPLLFNNDYSKKPAYSAVLQGLKAQ
jgi:endo-1,4-beta-xylanase